MGAEADIAHSIEKKAKTAAAKANLKERNAKKDVDAKVAANASAEKIDLATANVIKCSKEKTEADEAKAEKTAKSEVAEKKKQAADAKQSEKINKAEGEQKQKRKADRAEKAAKTKDAEAKERTNAQNNKQTLACENIVEKGAKGEKEGKVKAKAAEVSAEGLIKTQEKMKQTKLEKGTKFRTKAKSSGI